MAIAKGCTWARCGRTTDLLNEAKPRLPYTEFYNDAINSMYNPREDYQRHSSNRYIVLREPPTSAPRDQLSKPRRPSFWHANHQFLLNAASKSEALHVENLVQQAQATPNLIFRLLLAPMDESFFVLTVRRNNIVRDTIVQVCRHSERVGGR